MSGVFRDCIVGMKRNKPPFCCKLPLWLMWTVLLCAVVYWDITSDLCIHLCSSCTVKCFQPFRRPISNKKMLICLNTTRQTVFPFLLFSEWCRVKEALDVFLKLFPYSLNALQVYIIILGFSCFLKKNLILENFRSFSYKFLLKWSNKN